MDKTLIFLGLGAILVIGSILVYVLLMIFLPEWVGITGKTALEQQKSHKGEEPTNDEFDKTLDKWHKS